MFSSRRSVPVIANARAAWWVARSIWKTQRAVCGLPGSVLLPPVPDLPESAERGIAISLRLLRPTCLVGAMVRQAWYLSQGDPRDLVIGVSAPSKGFAAHAWLEGDPPCHSKGFHELVRRSARA